MNNLALLNLVQWDRLVLFIKFSNLIFQSNLRGRPFFVKRLFIVFDSIFIKPKKENTYGAIPLPATSIFCLESKSLPVRVCNIFRFVDIFVCKEICTLNWKFQSFWRLHVKLNSIFIVVEVEINFIQLRKQWSLRCRFIIRSNGYDYYLITILYDHIP